MLGLIIQLHGRWNGTGKLINSFGLCAPSLLKIQQTLPDGLVILVLSMHLPRIFPQEKILWQMLATTQHNLHKRPSLGGCSPLA